MVCLSVALAYYDHVAKEKWKWAHYRTDWCLGYLQAEADPDRSILRSQIMEEGEFGTRPTEVIERGCYGYNLVEYR